MDAMDAGLSPGSSVVAGGLNPLLPRGADAPRSPVLEPLFAGRTAAGNQPTLYVCENFTCQAPASGAKNITAAIERLAGGEIKT
jgi:uncharacterized protein YyaL (SSP411 family)